MTMDPEALQDLIRKHMNPTGINHTATPWRADKSRKEYGGIVTETGTFVGFFRRVEDRDLALYFVNSHAAIIALMQQFADSVDFLANATEEEGTRHYALELAERTRIYADLFTRLGKLETEEAPS